VSRFLQDALVQLSRSWFSGFVARISASACVFVGACADGPTSVRPIPKEIRLLSPPTNSGTPGWPLPDSVIVEVLDAEGRALSGVSVRWTAANGADVIGQSSDTTNIAGRASAEWTLGRTEGEQVLSIQAGDLAPLTVAARATIFHAASVTVGAGFACALTDAGRAFCWGRNEVGQLGRGATGDPVFVPAPVAGELVFAALTASDRHACALTTDGSAYCWGGNENGETGTGAVGNTVPAPTPVQTGLRFTRISAEGVGTSTNATCALTAVGEAWCWGSNEYGQLGDGTTSRSAVPVRVQSEVPFTSIETGYFHSCATATTGELWCWGQQEADTGALGARPAGLYTTPVLVHQDFRFTGLAAGWNYTCGLTTEDAALCWGANWHGGLGIGEAEPSPDPVAVAGGHSFVALFSAGYKGTHGLTRDGVIYRWGTSGTGPRVPTPVRVTDLRFTSIESGEEPFEFQYGACGISAGNAVYCVRDEGIVRGVPAPAAP
jgi:alpha-tubulin suppressor-like RCC1 family protein